MEDRLDEDPITGEGRDDYHELLKVEKLPEKLSILRQKLYQKAKNEPKFRFYTLYAHVSRDDVLEFAWRVVKRNRGAAGIDGKTIEDVEASGVKEFLLEIQQSLRNHEYNPGPVRRVYIPKPQGGERPLGIPNVRDRVVQAAVRLIIEPIFEADFKDCSYGFRPGRSQHDALDEVAKHLKDGFREVYNIDIKGYFDNIPHDKLLKSILVRIADPGVVKLIRLWLEAPVIERDKNGKTGSTRPTKGTPQGGVISPLLANIYLHWMDKMFHSARGPAAWAKAKMVRYADDIVILTRYVGSQVKQFVTHVLEERLGLEVNQGKTKIVNLMAAGASTDFLGFTFRFDRDLQGRPWKYLNIGPSQKALKRERGRLREMTSSHQCFKPIPRLVTELNDHLESWKPYYNYGYPAKGFGRINQYVRQRLVVHLRRRSQRPFRPSPGVSLYECLERFGLVSI